MFDYIDGGAEDERTLAANQAAFASATFRHGFCAAPTHPHRGPTLSTLGACSIEAVRAVSSGRLWFQVCAWRYRGLVEKLIERAAAARYEALVLSVDTAVLGRPSPGP